MSKITKKSNKKTIEENVYNEDWRKNMEKNDYLLTDEFVAFSQKISQIFEAKKAKKLELKNFYEKIQNEIKTLEEEAKTAEAEFEAFKNKNQEN